MQDAAKRFVGIDLAKRSLVVHIIDSESNKAEHWSGKTDPRGIKTLCTKLRPTDKVAVECCAHAFFLAKEIKAKVGCEVNVLNAGQLAVIYKSTKKTDSEDAIKLAWILQRFPTEELPTVDLPSEKEEHRRALVSELRSNKKERNALVNRLHSLFVRQGITTIEKKDLKTFETRRKIIGRLEHFTRSEAERICQKLLLIEGHIQIIESEIAEDLKQDDLAPYLLSVPGVGPSTAMAFLAHVGNGSRFTSGRQVSNFVGMAPRVDSSGETTKIGSITKRGCVAIRGVIVQAAWAAVHSIKENDLKKKFIELRDRRGNGRAIVAIARRILELMWILVVRKEFFKGYNNLDLDLKLKRLGLKKVG